jgi:hypothetical protein
VGQPSARVAGRKRSPGGRKRFRAVPGVAPRSGRESGPRPAFGGAGVPHSACRSPAPGSFFLPCRAYRGPSPVRPGAGGERRPRPRSGPPGLPSAYRSGPSARGPRPGEGGRTPGSQPPVCGRPPACGPPTGPIAPPPRSRPGPDRGRARRERPPGDGPFPGPPKGPGRGPAARRPADFGCESLWRSAAPCGLRRRRARFHPCGTGPAVRTPAPRPRPPALTGRPSRAPRPGWWTPSPSDHTRPARMRPIHAAAPPVPWDHPTHGPRRGPATPDLRPPHAPGPVPPRCRARPRPAGEALRRPGRGPERLARSPARAPSSRSGRQEGPDSGYRSSGR